MVLRVLVSLSSTSTLYVVHLIAIIGLLHGIGVSARDPGFREYLASWVHHAAHQYGAHSTAGEKWSHALLQHSDMHVGEALSLLEKAAKKQEQVHDILIGGAQRLEMNSNSSSSAPGAEERPLPNLSAALGDVYGKLEETVLTSGPGTGQMENENATKERGGLHGHLSTARTRVVAENVHYLLNAMTVAFVSRLLELVDVPLDFSVRSLIDDEAEATGAWLLGTTEDGKAETVQQHPHAHRILQGLVASAAGAASRGQHQQRLEFPQRNGDSSWSKLERARAFLQGLEDLQREAEDVAETHAGHEQPHDVHELYLALADFEHRQEAVRRKHSVAMRAFWSQYGERILVNARRLFFGLQDDEFLRVLDAKFEGFADEVEDATMNKRRKLGVGPFFYTAVDALALWPGKQTLFLWYFTGCCGGVLVAIGASLGLVGYSLRRGRRKWKKLKTELKEHGC